MTEKANQTAKSPELLARYCDLLLKKSAKNPEEAELEDLLGQVVRIFFFNNTGIYCGPFQMKSASYVMEKFKRVYDDSIKTAGLVSPRVAKFV